MPQCETCGNEYEKAMLFAVAGKSHWFDSFECAMRALAPAGAHCAKEEVRADWMIESEAGRGETASG
jgi:hypothetical protein